MPDATALVHSAARDGFTREARTYGRGRPDYPPALAGWLTGALGLGPGRRVADVGAGTGKFTRLLIATGAQALAIEPVAAMRDEAARLPGVEVRDAPAQALPVADAALDAIVCAQAFHWFAQAAVLDEFARALRPGGALGLVWNVRDESVDWVARITRLITPYEGDAPRFHKGDWRRPFPHPAFSALVESAFPYEHVGPPQQVIIDRFMSVSFIAAQPEAERDRVRAALERLVATHPQLRGQDTVRFPYRTLAFHCRRSGG
ncbi:class I SAM-dependent methyltransferase [Ramlibacter sp.]|uniref:class I SAM-dependent methyltransferase n=1 Tax=Ramlibacter sp. TaxID=1917967 RepID=UPI002B6D229A|nr:methyltransferase domain-containing protein [Ramlibacter sp.]HWI80567.1 methyltransferase domain-containing protein [Ramlibacter sp.]